MLQERREGPLTEVGGVDEPANLAREDEALVLVETADLKLLFGLSCTVTPKGSLQNEPVEPCSVEGALDGVCPIFLWRSS